MRHFENMLRQHASIHEDLNFLVAVLEKDSTDINATDVALCISRLAGKLKVHMLEEDKFLYPELLQSPDAEVKAMAHQYISEMGHLAEEYTRFKTEYNTANKILAKPEVFISEARQITQALVQRMDKEDHELYILVQKRQKGN
jgi:hemerythrin-like domain-containing protein